MRPACSFCAALPTKTALCHAPTLLSKPVLRVVNTTLSVHNYRKATGCQVCDLDTVGHHRSNSSTVLLSSRRGKSARASAVADCRPREAMALSLMQRVVG